MSKVRLDDGRISKFQRQIYDWLRELYPSIEIELEKLIPESGQRIDIYIDLLTLAIECDGTFHDKPEFFYVKSEEAWNDIIQRDKKKEYDLYHHGIKLVRIPYKHKMKSAEDLRDYINSVEDPEIEFNEDIFKPVNDFKEKSLEHSRKINHENYKKYIEENKEDLKKKRKENYRKNKTKRVLSEEEKKALKDKRKKAYQDRKNWLKENKES